MKKIEYKDVLEAIRFSVKIDIVKAYIRLLTENKRAEDRRRD